MGKKTSKSEHYLQQGYVVREQNEEPTAFFQNSISVSLVIGPYPDYVRFYLAESDEIYAIGDNREEALKNFKTKARKKSKIIFLKS